MKITDLRTIAVQGLVGGEHLPPLAEAKAAVESGDADEMQQKTAALTQAAMKLGEAMYKAQQAETEAAAGPDAGP